MKLVKWNPMTRTLPGFSSMLDEIFNSDFNTPIGRDFSGTVPAVNVIEGTEKFTIEVAAPGLKKANFELSVEDSTLTIKGNKEVEKEESADNFTRKEFSYASFTRSFNLPETVDGNAIKANYKDGILLIDIPKKEETKQQPVRTIKIS